ncbi:hypothetical protein [Pseudomonas sp. NFACC05-1]|uniref:hypothetical protein n=1 Tax=Pseudomonas sp. NFACC05-1 TaxID=1566241 RepID=UPI00087126CF|nr:hypothetical protein [Pseudomonas sp. NFACC05-1]SCW97484.1 hypothetical protein SAMN03159424_05696 [Pseudomonas sp. NFACC05-1]
MKALKLVVILLSIDAGYTLADSCDAILDEKLMTASSIVDQSEAESAAKYAFCNKSFSEIQKSTSGSIGGSFKFISANASKDESSFNKWKQSNCGDSSSSSATAKYRFSAQKALGEGVVEAWRTCMLQRDGLSCLVSPGSDNESVNFIYSWRPKGTGKTELLGSTIYNGSRISSEDEKNKVAKDASTVYPGKQNIIIIRDDTKKKTIVSMNTLYNGDVTDECHVEVPALISKEENAAPAINVKTIKGRWCYSSASGAASSGMSAPPSVEFIQSGDNWQVYYSPTQGARIPAGGVDRVEVEDSDGEVTVTEVSKDMMLPPPKIPSLYFRGPFPAPHAPVTPSQAIPGVIPAPGTAPLPAPSGSSEGLIITTVVKYDMPNNNTLQARSVSVTTNVTGDENSGSLYPLIRYSRCD